MPTSSQIRSSFLTYFEEHNHTVVPSSPLVPQNDPTLMFVNAGMVPFKDVFTGQETKGFTRAASSQKCVRAGGKHNDLENVGHTARHHTFFEMLGNFSFGDYFKDHAIELAWNLITKEYQIPKDRLIVTVYSEDDEAFKLWQKISGFGADRILKIPTADNFWSMGETGPCGPCSEIFYDHGENIPGGLPGTPEEDGDRFVEIWNLVFMQYMIETAGGPQLPLPKPSIDTGMGLERISAVLQGVHDNYDIDLFRNIIEASQQAIGSQAQTPEQNVSHRVIADHLRSACFMLADGVMPSNEGRGYVLRRIMRRGMRHAHLLGSKDPHMYRLVPALIKEMGDAFPELTRAKTLLEDVLKLEETRFKETLDRGLRLLKDETAKLSQGSALPGDVAFKLYDTFGFPLDLTQDVLKSENRDVDVEGFEAAMAEQKQAAKAAWSGSGDVKQEKVWFDLHDSFGANEFLGYQTTQAEGVIQAIVMDGQSVEQANEGQQVHILLNQTPFYGESGGQIGDSGVITTETAEVKIDTTHLILRDMHVLSGTIEKGTLTTGDVADQIVDEIRRDRIRGNHSATHLLHAALRHTLGDGLVQKGSLVAPDRLRFDFSHTSALTREQISEVEDAVNARIRLNEKVETRLMPSEDAKAAGAMALFGEKYADEVRVVSMGGQQQDKDYSLELCGGTHVRRTGDIGFFKIISESGIAAGVRRIEAITGHDALVYCQRLENLTDATAHLLKTSTEKLNDKVSALLDERKKLEKDIKALQQKLASGGSGGQSQLETQDVNGVTFVHRNLEGVSARDVKPIVDQIKQKIGSGIVMVTSTDEDKVTVVVGVTKDLTDTYSAVDLVREASQILGGKGGGGRPDMAQAGGTLPGKTDEAAKALVDFLSK